MRSFVRLITSVSASLNAAISSAVPIDTRSQPSGPVSRISTPWSTRPCQTACRSANRAEQHEVGVGVGDLEPLLAQPRHGRVALGAQVVDVAEQLGRVPQRRQRGRLGDGREVVGQPHDPDRVADRRVGGEVAEPRAGERERLAHRAASPRGCGAAAAARARSACRPGGTRRTPRRRRRCRPSSTPRPRTASRPPRAAAPCRSGCSGSAAARRAAAARGRASRAASRSREKSSARWPTTHSVIGVAGVLGIHRVRRREAQRHPAGSAEGLQELQHHLVGAVGRPHHVGRDAVPPDVLRYAASASRSAVNSRSG